MDNKILEVKNLKTELYLDKESIFPVNDVSFDVYKGKTLGIVGESGSGKTMTALSIMRLLNNSNANIIEGEIIFENRNLLKLNDSEIRKIRGKDISMIFQDPMTSLNPVFTIGNQISEVFMLHKKMNFKEAKDRSIEMLQLVGISSSEKRFNEYPHQLSGGMRQRVMIAIALACKPKVLIADEPTTALDVTIQAQILDLMKKLREEIGMGIIIITHDMGVVAEVCDEVAVMYCGKIIEKADEETLFNDPKHHYTKGLLESIPSIIPKSNIDNRRLSTIKGVVPPLSNLPNGCNFQDRCNRADVECKGKNGDPSLFKINKKQFAACFHPLKHESILKVYEDAEKDH